MKERMKSDLQWTTERPRYPGFYFARNDILDNILNMPTVVHFKPKYDSQGSYEMFGVGTEEPLKIESFQHYSGPISPPEKIKP